MACGHCQAVCPAGALRIGVPHRLGLSRIAERLDAVQPGQSDASALVQLMRSRRSCRNYREQPVELALLEDLVRVGTTAPSGTNSQAWNFTILPSRGDVELLGEHVASFFRELNQKAENPLYRFLAAIFAGNALGRYHVEHYSAVKEALRDWDEAGLDRLFHGATAAILVSGDRSASCPQEDGLLATQNILLAAHAMGLGSCLIGYVVEAMRHSRKIRQAMAIPPGEDVYSVIALGHPAIYFREVTGRRPIQPRVLHLHSM